MRRVVKVMMVANLEEKTVERKRAEEKGKNRTSLYAGWYKKKKLQKRVRE